MAMQTAARKFVKIKL